MSDVRKVNNDVELDIERKEELDSMRMEYANPEDKEKLMKVDLTDKDEYFIAYPTKTDDDKDGERTLFMMAKGNFKEFIANVIETMLLNVPSEEQLEYITTKYTCDIGKMSTIKPNEKFGRCLMTGNQADLFYKLKYVPELEEKDEEIKSLKATINKLQTQVESYKFAIKKLGK